jgi:hypothetical protein
MLDRRRAGARPLGVLKECRKAVPFLTAILLNELRHAKGYLRVLVYLPVMLPPASALLLFAYFYDPAYAAVSGQYYPVHPGHDRPPELSRLVRPARPARARRSAV